MMSPIVAMGRPVSWLGGHHQRFVMVIKLVLELDLCVGLLRTWYNARLDLAACTFPYVYIHGEIPIVTF